MSVSQKKMYNKFHHVETQNLLGDMTLRSAKSANRRESLHVLNVINKPTFTNPKQSFVIHLRYGSCFFITEHQGTTVFWSVIDELFKKKYQ